MNGFVNDLKKAAISADATKAAAYATAGAMQYSADQAAGAAMYGADKSYEAKKYEVDNNWKTNPVGYGQGVVSDLIDIFSGNPKGEYKAPWQNYNPKDYGPEFAWDNRSGAS